MYADELKLLLRPQDELKSLYVDWYDNYTYAILDACVLSSFRTATISLLSFFLVFDKKKYSLGLLGLGRVGSKYAQKRAGH